MRRMMIAGTGSGSGKTTITCGLLKALSDRGLLVSAFKCGPDYIDPMFHNRIVGVKSRNLDSYFCNKDTLNYLLHKNAGELSVIEGVMGFYDGVGATGSSWQVSENTKTPVAVVLDCRGMSLSMGAVMKGFLEYLRPNRICGFIFNRLAQSQEALARELCRELHTEYLGRMPYDSACAIESRHLGLVTPEEITDLKEKVARLGELCEQYLCIDKIISLAESAEPLSFAFPEIKQEEETTASIGGKETSVRIAVARDTAFCFYYEDNLDVRRELGCELIPFSPMEDERLPDGICGMLLGGGYPELYAEQLSQNKTMRLAIRKMVGEGLPTIAECGGFMYLNERMEDTEGRIYEMAGAVPGTVRKKERLMRFGYVDLTARVDTMLCPSGQTIPAHEFHYWDSDCPGDSFIGEKRSRNERYSCVVANESLYAGFPHLHFYGEPDIAFRFVESCKKYKKAIEKKNQKDRIGEGWNG